MALKWVRFAGGLRQRQLLELARHLTWSKTPTGEEEEDNVVEMRRINVGDRPLWSCIKESSGSKAMETLAQYSPIFDESWIIDARVERNDSSPSE